LKKLHKDFFTYTKFKGFLIYFFLFTVIFILLLVFFREVLPNSFHILSIAV